jgi:hypothetical protein
MDGEGLGEAKKWSRKKLVGMGVFEPNDEERKAMEAAQANAQPDANQAYLMNAAKKEESVARLNEAKVGQTVADTLGKLAGIEQGREAHALQLAAQLQASSQPAQGQPAAPEQAPPQQI